jgi:hypothetical protein
MKQLILALVLASCAGGLAVAQPVPPEQQSPTPDRTAPPSDYPQSAQPATPQDSTSTADKRALMKKCVAQEQEQASSSGMTKKQIKDYCKKEVKQTTAASQDQPPR